MTDQGSTPDFGPGGYLPPRAAKRARKIVLREQMGFGWPLAAVAASLLVAIAGGAYLYASNRAPGPPFVAAGQLTSVPAGEAQLIGDQGDQRALVVRAGGSVRAFRAAGPEVSWCEESGRIETARSAWGPDGRLLHGQGQSLQPLRSVVRFGVVYVDFTTALPRPEPALGGEPPVCAGQKD
jgi:hypothetical protein